MNKKNNGQAFWNDVKIVPYLYILPNMLLFIVFMIVPLFMSFYLSLTKWNGMGKIEFILFDNYVALLKDKVFITSFFNTIRFTVIVVPLLMALALLLAIFLNQKLFMRGFVRGALYIPSVISMVAAGMIFSWMFNPKIGLINYILTSLNFTAIDWLNDPKYAMIMIIFGALWSKIGYNMVIYIAGLQGISPEYYEAATIDGANSIQRFRHITFPLLRSTHIFILITCVIYTFKTFDLIYVMTKGGPLNSTKTMVVYIYEMAFGKNRYGQASAAGVVLFLILMIFTVMRLKSENKEG